MYSLTSCDHIITAKPVILNLDYSNSVLTGLSALLLPHLSTFSTLHRVPLFLYANLITLPLSLKYFSCLHYSAVQSLCWSIENFIWSGSLSLPSNLVPLPLLVSSLCSSDSQSVVHRPFRVYEMLSGNPWAHCLRDRTVFAFFTALTFILIVQKCDVHYSALGMKNTPVSLKNVPDEAVKLVDFIKFWTCRYSSWTYSVMKWEIGMKHFHSILKYHGCFRETHLGILSYKLN